MSIDRRIRRSLESEGSRIEPDTRTALAHVQRRVSRSRRRNRATTLVAVLASTLLVLLVVPRVLDLGRTGPQTASEPPNDIRGNYVVDVQNTASARAEGMAGRWVVSFEADGVLELRAPAGFSGSTSGITYRVEGDRLHTDALVEGPGCQAAGAFVGVYRWTRDENELRFTAVEDVCTARRLLFHGQVWERLPG